MSGGTMVGQDAEPGEREKGTLHLPTASPVSTAAPLRDGQTSHSGRLCG